MLSGMQAGIGTNKEDIDHYLQVDTTFLWTIHYCSSRLTILTTAVVLPCVEACFQHKNHSVNVIILKIIPTDLRL